ncbi:hypothetical protein AB0N05_34350 [Nocardia sp. NPDC051030]|uniref:carboxymuconolactone decarboxylase family protein n=1 Tax=Nocardia sp. NPDC051030 TaxID=3155162 RepID=UPI003436DDEE
MVKGRDWTIGASMARGAGFGNGFGVLLRRVRFVRLDPADCTAIAHRAAELAGCAVLVDAYRTDHSLSPTLARAVEELYRDRYLSDNSWDALDLDPAQRVELCFLVGLIDLIAIVENTLTNPAQAAVETPLRTGRTPAEPGWLLPEQPRLPRPEFREIGVRAWAFSRGVGALMGCGRIDGPEMFARSPRMFWSVAPLLVRLGPLRMGRRNGELVTLRATWNVGSEYHWGHHGFGGRVMGLSEATINRVAAGPGAPGWGSEDAAILRAVDDLHEHRAIREPALTELRTFFDDGQIAELCLLAANYEMLCMALNSFGIRFEEGAWYGGPTRYLLAFEN